MNFNTDILFISIIIVNTLSGCSKSDSKIVNLNNGKIGIVGHGGNGFQSELNHLPHNSFGSIIKAIEGNQADGVELDVQMSKDEQLILYHDRTLQSMTNCHDCISNNVSSDILKCKYKNNFSTNVLEDENVIDLELVIERLSARKIKPILFLDIKMFNKCDNDFKNRMLFAKNISEIILKHNAKKWIKVQSTSIDFLNILQQSNTEIHLILEGGNGKETIEMAKSKNFYGIVSSNNSISYEEVKQAHSVGLNVILFNVKTRAGTIEAINKHPDFIITDNILLLQKCLKK
ncbi:MAG: glycerophosphodiester phosphodiesterase [Bacteroidota bacterium]|nr:glycerophosphodiester phosphodiesterase [Bacteroidota bacterium]